MTRHRVVLALLGVIAIVAAIGYGYIFLSRDACMDGSSLSGTGSCPSLVEVRGVRYGVGIPKELVETEGNLTEYGQITRTNVPEQFSERTAFALNGLDPAAVLVARSAFDDPEDFGDYRLLFVTGSGDADAAWPEICRYFTEADRAADVRCGQ